MQLQITTDYAIRIVGYLYRHPNEVCTAIVISENISVSYQFFMKVANRLKKQGLITAQQGCKGGYSLCRPGNKITLLDIIYAIEGDIGINRCLRPDEYCNTGTQSVCSVRKVFVEAQTALADVLKKYTIADIFSENNEVCC